MKRLKDFLQKEELNEDGSPDINGDGILSPGELHQHLDIQRRGFVDMGDYAAHILFHSHHPEYLADVIENFNDVQKRHANGEEVCENDPVLDKLKNRKTLVATNVPMTEGKTASNKDIDPPAVLIMRRKSVRQFPNGQRVALYYVDKINKYVTVPYDDMQWSSMGEENTVFGKLQKIVESKQKTLVEHFDGTRTEVTPEVAKSIIDLYKKINESNKEKLKEMLEASSKHFQTIAKFSKE